MKRWICGIIVLAAALGLSAASAPAAGPDHHPALAYVAAFNYPGITIGSEDKVRVDLVVRNLGEEPQTIHLKLVESPPGWQARITSLGTQVDGVFLTPDQPGSTEFLAEPAPGQKLEPGQYRFVLEARGQGPHPVQTSELVVTVAPRQEARPQIELATSYPVLRGPSDSRFEFNLDVRNNTGADGLFNFTALAPQGWEVGFKPAYEQKQISSVQIKGDASASVGVEITPPAGAPAGEHPIKVQVSGGGAKAQTDLTVALTGTHQIKMGTSSGLLSLGTNGGRPATVTLLVHNQGTAPQREVQFLSFKPENWKVEFKPEKLADLQPQDVAQVEMTITPAADSLVGDYSVAASARGEKAQDELELRVTVNADATWGWVGVAIIILVLAGLGLMFRKFGRR